MIRSLPTVLDHDNKKGLLASKKNDGEGFYLSVVWLNEEKEYKSRGSYGDEDIERIDTVLYFSDKESVEATIDVLKKMLKMW